MGVNQGHESTRTAQAIINLALMTGNIGRPGTAPNSITGQCNAMGSRLFGNATSLLGGYDLPRPAIAPMSPACSTSRPRLIPDAPSLAYDEILDAIDRGKSAGSGSLPPTPRTLGSGTGGSRRCARSWNFLVVQDMYATTETAQMATSCCPPPAGARRRACSSTASAGSAS